MSGSIAIQQMESLARQGRIQYGAGIEAQALKFCDNPGVIYSDSTNFGTATVDIAQWVPDTAVAVMVSVRAQRTGTFGPLEIYASADWVDKWIRIGVIEDGETMCFSTLFIPVFGRKVKIKVDDACDNVFEVSAIAFLSLKMTKTQALQ